MLFRSIAVSVVTALLPKFSDMANSIQINKLSNSINKASLSLINLLLPISVIMFFIGQPLAQILFARGAATITEARSTGFLLSIFVIGLVPFSLFYLLLRGFYALEDTRTPFFINIVLNLINLSVAIYCFNVFSNELKVAGLVVGYVASYLITTPILWLFLSRKGLNLKTSLFIKDALKPIFASFLVFLVLYLMGKYITLFVSSDSFLTSLWQVIIWGISGSVLYFVLSLFLGINLIKDFASKILK